MIAFNLIIDRFGDLPFAGFFGKDLSGARSFDVDLDEEPERKDQNGPPPGIFVFDLANEPAMRVTAKGV
jgi:hypothetical protein